MKTNKSKLHGTIGLFTILLIGFGFGAFLFMQPASTADHQSDHETAVEVESHGEPGIEMSGHDMASMENTENQVQNNSPITLLSIFLGINLAIIIAALVLKRVRSKDKVNQHVLAPTSEIAGGSK